MKDNKKIEVEVSTPVEGLKLNDQVWHIPYGNTVFDKPTLEEGIVIGLNDSECTLIKFDYGEYFLLKDDLFKATKEEAYERYHKELNEHLKELEDCITKVQQEIKETREVINDITREQSL